MIVLDRVPIARHIFGRMRWTAYGSCMQLWPGAVNFPDFFAQQTIEWWTSQIQGVYSQLPLDGLWIDMHEPSNFCTGDVLCAARCSPDSPMAVSPLQHACVCQC